MEDQTKEEVTEAFRIVLFHLSYFHLCFVIYRVTPEIIHDRHAFKPTAVPVFHIGRKVIADTIYPTYAIYL